MTLKPSSCSVRYDSVMYVCVQDENTYTTEFIHKDILGIVHAKHVI